MALVRSYQPPRKRRDDLKPRPFNLPYLHSRTEVMEARHRHNAGGVLNVAQPILFALPNGANEIDLSAVFNGYSGQIAALFNFYSSAGANGPFILLASQASPLYQNLALLPGQRVFYEVTVTLTDGRTSPPSAVVVQQTAGSGPGLGILTDAGVQITTDAGVPINIDSGGGVLPTGWTADSTTVTADSIVFTADQGTAPAGGSFSADSTSITADSIQQRADS